MARLNIETSIYAEHEFQDLMIKVGDRQKAKGMAQELWELAQRYWYPDRKLIPIEEFKKSGLELTLEAGMARIQDGEIYAKGTREAFEWLFQAQEAGKKSAAVRATRPKKPKKISTTVERPSTDVQPPSTTVEGVSTSLLSSLSSSLSSLKSESKGAVSDGATTVERSLTHVENPVGYFIAAYVKAFQKRYPETRPDLRGKVQGQIKRFVGETPIHRACELIQTYCQMSGKKDWFVTKGHDFGTFLENLNPVSIALAQGKEATEGIDWEKFNFGEKGGAA